MNERVAMGIKGYLILFKALVRREIREPLVCRLGREVFGETFAERRRSKSSEEG